MKSVGKFDGLPIRSDSMDGRNITVVLPFTFTRPNGEVITVPVGTTSDGASTPRAIWSTLPPFGTYWPAAVLHDYLYRTTQVSKEDCDTILEEAMEALGVNESERIVIYEGVHLGGQHSFDEDRKQNS